MARSKTTPDESVLEQVIHTLNDLGEKSVSFGVISKQCGLAPATIAQRFGTVEAMLRAAVLAEWERLLTGVAEAEAEALVSAKGVQGLLKSLGTPSTAVLQVSMRDESLRDAAERWRSAVEAAFAARRGGGIKGRDTAALLFAAWQGRQLWEGAGGKGFKLSDLIKSLA